MQRLLLIILLGYLLIIVSCKDQSCHNLSANFPTYKMATTAVKTASFQIEDSFTSDSWISNGAYYSCDGKKGFIIIKTAKKEQDYIYKDVEYSTWKKFKDSDSKGRFYNQYH